MHEEGGCYPAGRSLCYDRIQCEADFADEHRQLTHQHRHISEAGWLDSLPADSASLGSASVCAPSLNLCGDLPSSPLDFSSFPGFHNFVDTTVVPSHMSFVSPVAFLSLLGSGCYMPSSRVLESSCASKFPSFLGQDNLGGSHSMLFETCSEQQLTSVIDSVSANSVMLCSEVRSFEFQFNSGSEFFSGTSVMDAKKENMPNHTMFLPDIVKEEIEFSFLEDCCEENLQPCNTTLFTSVVSHGPGASPSDNPVVQGQTSWMEPVCMRHMGAPYKDLSPGSMKRSNRMRTLRQLDSVLRPDSVSLCKNKHLQVEDNGVLEYGLSELCPGEHLLLHEQQEHTAWLGGGRPLASLVSPNDKDSVLQTCPSRSDVPVEGLGWVEPQLVHAGRHVSLADNGSMWPDVRILKYDMLYRVALSLEEGNLDGARVMLARLSLQLEDSFEVSRRRSMSSKVASVRPIQDRVALLFKEGFMARLSGHESQLRETDPLDVLNNVTAFKHFSEVSPVLNFSYFSANRAILESMAGETKFHVLDFEAASSGTQWASLLFEMANRACSSPVVSAFGSDINSCCKPGLHLTLVGLSSKEMLSTGESLLMFAKELNVDLTFHPVVVNRLSCLELNMLAHAQGDEPLAVNIVFSLHRLLGADEFSKCNSQCSSPTCIPTLKRIVDELSPKVVTVVAKHVGLDTTSLTAWLTEGLHHYSLLLQSITPAVNSGDQELQASAQSKSQAPFEHTEGPVMQELERESTNRQGPQWNETIDKFLFVPEIKEMICWKELGMVGVPEAHQWRRRLESSGLRPRHLSGLAESEAQSLLANFSGQGFGLSNKEGSLMLTWRGHPLVTSSAWVCL